MQPFLVIAVLSLCSVFIYRRSAMRKAGKIADQFPGNKPNWFIGNIAQIGKVQDLFKFFLENIFTNLLLLTYYVINARI